MRLFYKFAVGVAVVCFFATHFILIDRVNFVAAHLLTCGGAQ